MSETFLTKEELATLTGRKTKSKQIEALRKMALPFWVNALNAPIVPRSAINQVPTEKKQERERWVPNVLSEK